MWNVRIITAYPEMFPGVLGFSIIGKSLKEKIWNLNVINLREFTSDRNKKIDDIPFGGGPGMVIRPDIVEKAFMSIPQEERQNLSKIYLTPSGKPLDQKQLFNFSKNKGLIILCGRFEGIDSRVIDSLGFLKISLGDYVLTGGEVASQALVEGCVRLLPGVLGDSDSVTEESFSENLLEYPHYTKPQDWVDRNGISHKVPNILVSGHHQKIKEWRKKASISVTKEYRPDLLKRNNGEYKENE